MTCWIAVNNTTGSSFILMNNNVYSDVIAFIVNCFMSQLICRLPLLFSKNNWFCVLCKFGKCSPSSCFKNVRLWCGFAFGFDVIYLVIDIEKYHTKRTLKRKKMCHDGERNILFLRREVCLRKISYKICGFLGI